MTHRARLTLEALEDKLAPAVLDVTAGALTFTAGPGENNSLVVAVASGIYSLRDAGALVALTPNATAAGWRGSGTNTVSGPAAGIDSLAVSVGDGTNQVNVRSVMDPVAIDGGVGMTAVNLSSNAPVNTGNTAGLRGNVTVTAGADTSLVVGGMTDVVRGPVTIDPAGVHGFLAGGFDVAANGTLASLNVRGSNAPALAESFTLAGSPALATRLDCGAGADTVIVTADTTADVYLGSGDDTLTVLSGVTLTGDVHTGTGTDVVNANSPDYGTVTGTIGG